MLLCGKLYQEVPSCNSHYTTCCLRDSTFSSCLAPFYGCLKTVQLTYTTVLSLGTLPGNWWDFNPINILRYYRLCRSLLAKKNHYCNILNKVGWFCLCNNGLFTNNMSLLPWLFFSPACLSNCCLRMKICNTQAAEILYFKNAPACLYQTLPELNNIEIVATLFLGKMHECYKKKNHAKQ